MAICVSVCIVRGVFGTTGKDTYLYICVPLSSTQEAGLCIAVDSGLNVFYCYKIVNNWDGDDMATMARFICS